MLLRFVRRLYGCQLWPRPRHNLLFSLHISFVVRDQGQISPIGGRSAIPDHAASSIPAILILHLFHFVLSSCPFLLLASTLPAGPVGYGDEVWLMAEAVWKADSSQDRETMQNAIDGWIEARPGTEHAAFLREATHVWLCMTSLELCFHVAAGSTSKSR